MATRLFLLALFVAMPAWAAAMGLYVQDRRADPLAQPGPKSMVIALDWTGRETQVLIDGKPAARPIAGEDFYRALLRIWLGDQPVQEDLKKSLLGAH